MTTLVMLLKWTECNKRKLILNSVLFLSNILQSSDGAQCGLRAEDDTKSSYGYN